MTMTARRLHIGLYCGSLPGEETPSGIATYVMVMRQALIDAGHRVTIVTFSDSQTDNSPARTTARTPSWQHRIRVRIAALGPSVGDSPGAGMTIAAHFARLHAVDPFDIVEMEESFGWSDAVAKALPIPVVTRLHGPHRYVRDAIESPEKRRISDRRVRAEGNAIARATAITSPTAGLLAAMAADHAGVPALSEVIPNPIAPVPIENRWVAERCNPKQILHIGRFDTVKGADIAIAAFSSIARVYPDSRLVIAGRDNGVTTTDGSLQRFDAYINEHVEPDISSMITFAGPLPRQELSVLRNQSGICLIPSRFESFSYVIAEAMAVGAPIVASATHGGTELIGKVGAGIVVPIGDVEATASALLWMIAHPQKAQALGVRARLHTAEWLDPGAVAERTVDFYQRVMAHAETARHG